MSNAWRLREIGRLTDMWQRTDQAPDNTWVVGFWEHSGEYAEVCYTHEQGWKLRVLGPIAPPTCWAPLPPSRTGAAPFTGETMTTDSFDCAHPKFDEYGLCMCCKEYYSVAHDKNPNYIHPALQRMMDMCEKIVEGRRTLMLKLAKDLRDDAGCSYGDSAEESLQWKAADAIESMNALRHQRALTERDRREAEQDAIEGMGWWNDLTISQQNEWMRKAHSSIPANCWRAYKAERAALLRR